MLRHVPLPGSFRTPLPNSRPAGSINPNEIVSVTVRTRPKMGVSEMEKLVQEQSAISVDKRKYMTRDELADAHGASADDLNVVEHVAHEHNLRVVHRSSAERTVVLKGRLGDVLNTFPADVHIFHHASGTYRGRRGEISIPSSLEGIVTGIFGLDTRPKHRSRTRRKTTNHAGPSPSKGLSPADFGRRYNFPTQHNGTSLDGSGQTIAIIELGGGFRNTDLQVYFNEIGVPLPKVSAISIDHAGNNPSDADSDDGEVMLDIEVAGAVAPKANIAVYFAPNDGNQGFLNAISAAVHDKERQPSVISISWGGPEVSTEKQALDAYHELFVAAAAIGVTVCVASGDHGTADLDAQHWDQQIHVDHPAVDSLVLACGGTQVENGHDVAWNDGTPFDINVQGGGGWATGGGVSTVFPVPAYQANANVPPSLANHQKGRGVPDIAMSATNYFVRVDSFEGPSGGTSAVAPLMAGLVALLNQGKGKKVGFLNPFLYANSANGIVKDVTKGTNAIKNTVKGYKAQKGWDPCTGLGTPDGNAILAKL
ncbi:MAG: kumamolisin [Methylobacteriaceae bacterium]|jgi:kumamolisin|nr:kumamolisin [Methylobacteriaceae bacterium]